MKVVKKQLEFRKEELKSSKETVETLERNLADVWEGYGSPRFLNNKS